MTADPTYRYSRWEKSDNTFGPVGRLVATMLLMLPLPILLMAVASGIGIVGAGIYVVLIVPWALRDIWQRARLTDPSTAARLCPPSPPAPQRAGADHPRGSRGDGEAVPASRSAAAHVFTRPAP